VRGKVSQNSAPLNHNEAEIAGYRDALNLIHENHDTLDIRERDILRLHEVMLSYVPISGCTYKQNDNISMEVDAASQRQVWFAPTLANETAAAMEQLVLAFMDARSNYSVNQLLLIPCLVLDFLCIHLPDVSPTTVEAALAAMVRNGIVDKIGSGKNTKYIKRER
jgi:Fic family protein